MAEARKDDDERPVADAAADLSRLAESSTRLFAEQAAAFAVMTAYGMGVAAQMTGLMLGTLRNSAEAEATPASEPAAAAADRVPAEMPKPTPAKVVPLRPRSTTPANSRGKTAGKAAKPGPSGASASQPKPVAKAPKAKAVVPAPRSGDDLKKISGIGPRLEQVLNERGIASYGDLAVMSKAALKKLDAELGLEGRTAKDDWLGQAKALSGGKG